MIKQINIKETIDQWETDGPLDGVAVIPLDTRLEIWENTRLILDAIRRHVNSLIEDDLIK